MKKTFILLTSLILIILIIGVTLFFVFNKEDKKDNNLSSNSNEYNLNDLKQNCENNPDVCFKCYNESNGLRLSATQIEDKNYCEEQCLNNPQACYIKLAQETLNSDFCKKVKTTTGIYLCYANLAKSSKDTTICQLITNEDKEYEQTSRNSCINFAKSE